MNLTGDSSGDQKGQPIWGYVEEYRAGDKGASAQQPDRRSVYPITLSGDHPDQLRTPAMCTPSMLHYVHVRSHHVLFKSLYPAAKHVLVVGFGGRAAPLVVSMEGLAAAGEE